MKYRPYMVAVALVAAWCVFACAYVGVEDGSSGLSPLGWVHVAFFLPGLILFQVINGAHSNADVPIMAGIGWVVFTALALAVAHAVVLIRRRGRRGEIPGPSIGGRSL